MKEKTKKILLCLGLAGVGASAYFIRKNYIDIKKINDKLVDEIGKIRADFDALDNMLDASFNAIKGDFEGIDDDLCILEHVLRNHNIDIAKEFSEYKQNIINN